jgi:hypothetical protein
VPRFVGSRHGTPRPRLRLSRWPRARRALGTPLLAPSRGVLLAGCVSLWAARLGGYLFYRVLQVRGSSAVRWGLWGRGAGFWGRRSGLHLGLPWGEPLGA